MWTKENDKRLALISHFQPSAPPPFLSLCLVKRASHLFTWKPSTSKVNHVSHQLQFWHSCLQTAFFHCKFMPLLWQTPVNPRHSRTTAAECDLFVSVLRQIKVLSLYSSSGEIQTSDLPVKKSIHSPTWSLLTAEPDQLLSQASVLGRKTNSCVYFSLCTSSPKSVSLLNGTLCKRDVNLTVAPRGPSFCRF